MVRSKSRYVAASVVCAAFVLFLLMMGADRNLDSSPPVSSKAAPASAPASATVPPRPKRWLNAPSPTVPKQGREEMFKQIAAQPANFPPPREQRLTDEATLFLIEQAKGRIAEHAPADGWKTKDVQAFARRIGDTVPIYVMSPSVPKNILAGFDAMNDRILVRPSLIAETSVDKLASQLFHESTHGVFKSELLKRLRMTMKELYFISYVCADVELMTMFVSEAIAWNNEVAWCDALPDPSVCDAHGVAPILAAARSARRGSPEGRAEFGQLMQNHAIFIRGQTNSDPKFRGCGPPVIFRGPSRGQLFFPSDLAPDLMVPLLDASQEESM